MKQTIKDAGYEYIAYNPKLRGHLLLCKATNILEWFSANKNHASWGLIYKNTHLEFCCAKKVQNKIF